MSHARSRGMCKSHRDAGLNQIGPVHWSNNADEATYWAQIKKVTRKPQSIKRRVLTGQARRKVKVTLATKA